jgi:hypothetical protein
MGPAELLQEYATLTKQALETQWQLAKDYGEATTQAVRGGPDPSAPATWARTVSAETARWWREAAQLGLSYGGKVLDLNRTTGERLVGAIAQSAPPRLAVTLSGKAGQTVRTPLAVANSRTTRERVTFRPGPLHPTSGADVDGVWTFDPGALELEPGAEQQVQMSLLLDDTIFTAGSSWKGVVAVIDGSGVVLEVDVTVDVS